MADLAQDAPMARTTTTATLHIAEPGPGDLAGLADGWTVDIALFSGVATFSFHRQTDDGTAGMIDHEPTRAAPTTEWRVSDPVTGATASGTAATIKEALAAIGEANPKLRSVPLPTVDETA